VTSTSEITPSVEGNTVVFYDKERDPPYTPITSEDSDIIVSMKFGSVELDIENNRKIFRNTKDQIYQIEEWT